MAPLGTLDVRPNAVLSSKGLHFEVDVYLPQFNTGIECKVFENSFSPMTAARLGSIQSQLSKQLRNYSFLGIKRVGIVTNLPTDSSEKLKTALTREVRSVSVVFEMVPGDVEDLVEWLDQLATRMAEAFNKGLEKSVQRIVKPKAEPANQPSSRRRRRTIETLAAPPTIVVRSAEQAQSNPVS